VGTLKSFATDGLDADLNDAIRLFKGTPHTAGVIGIKGHGLFLVDILAGLNGGNEVERMQVLGSSDEDGVDGFVVEQAPKIGVGLNGGNNLLGFVEAAGVDVGDGDSLGVGGVDSLFENVQSPTASTDQGKADAVIGAEDARGCEKGIADQGGSTSCNTVDEISSIEHGCGSLWVGRGRSLFTGIVRGANFETVSAVHHDEDIMLQNGGAKAKTW